MNRLLMLIALICCTFVVNSKPVYTADELHEMVLSGTNPEMLNPRLVYDSTGIVTFNKCVSTMRKLLSDLGSYPSVIERNSLVYFALSFGLVTDCMSLTVLKLMIVLSLNSISQSTNRMEICFN